MIYVIANELKMKGKKEQNAAEVKSVFARAGKECEILYTDHAGHAGEYAKALTSNGEENIIVAMGGDGTLHEILNGFCDFEANSLGLIPQGTGNDFAASANIPADVRAAAEKIAFREPEYIDFIELSNGLRSINAVGMGLDVEVLKRTYSGKGRGRGKYFRSLLKTVFGFKGFDFTVKANGVEKAHKGLIAAIGNGKQIGGGIKLFHDADIADGKLDLFVVDYITRRKLIGSLIKLMRGKVNKIKEATVMRVEEAEFLCGDGDFYIQAEGELYKNVPINAHVVSHKLKFYL